MYLLSLSIIQSNYVVFGIGMKTEICVRTSVMDLPAVGVFIIMDAYNLVMFMNTYNVHKHLSLI